VKLRSAGVTGMQERIWIFEYAWTATVILIVLVCVVSAVVGFATRDRSKDD
jgi:hypothetical protein